MNATIDWGRVIETGFTMIAVPFYVWLAKIVYKTSLVVFGANGNDGMNGDVLSLRKDRHAHANQLQVLDLEVKSLRSDVAEHDTRIAELARRTP